MIKLLQSVYIEKVLSGFHFDQTHVINTLMKEILSLQPGIKTQVLATRKEKYQGLIDFIIFSMVETRPDITFIISVASRFTKYPNHKHIKTVKTILQYFKDLKEQEITYDKQRIPLVERYSEFN